MHLQEKYYLTYGQYPLHHVTYAPKNFEVATCTSNGLGEDTITKKKLTDGRTDDGPTLVRN